VPRYNMEFHRTESKMEPYIVYRYNVRTLFFPNALSGNVGSFDVPRERLERPSEWKGMEPDMLCKDPGVSAEDGDFNLQEH